MDRNETAAQPLDASLKRLRAAVDSLESAIERRTRLDASRTDAADEFALMQDDRARLATELDAALDRCKALETANDGAGKRIASASATIENVLRRAGAGE
jgi:chromosome segregation ATPase